MSTVRPTGTFAPLDSDALSSNDGSNIRTRQDTASLRRQVPWLDGDIDVNGGLVPSRDGTFGGSASVDLPDAPRHTLAPASNGGASMRPAPRTTQRIDLSPRSVSAAERNQDALATMTRQELVARASELFDGVKKTVELLVSTLEEFSEDKTPTHSPRDPSRLRAALRSQLVSLFAVVGHADKSRTHHSVLAPLQHRVLREVADAIEAYDRRTNNKDRPASKVSSPAEALLYRLQNALKLRDKRPQISRHR